MEVLEELGIRSWINGSGKKDSARFGRFECPNCGCKIELKLSKGKTQKSCGSVDCRKALFEYNLNSGHSGAKKHGYSSKQEYSAFKEMYRLLLLRTEIVLCDRWKESLQNFVDDMYSQYVDARVDNRKVTLSCTEAVADITNSTFTKIATIREMPTPILSRSITRLDSKAIADIVGTTNTIVKRAAIRILGDTIINSLDTVILNGRTSFPISVYTFTESEYQQVLNVVTHNSNRAKSTNVYLIRSGKYTKIGISSDVSKRFEALQGSNPETIELLFSKEVGNARELEAMLHQKYNEQNLHHEWFTLTELEVAEAISVIENFKP